MIAPSICNEPATLKNQLEAYDIKRRHISVSYAVYKQEEDFNIEDAESGGFSFFVYGTLADAVLSAKSQSENMFNLPEGFQGGTVVYISEVQKRSKFIRWLLGDYSETTVYSLDYNSQSQTFKEKDHF